MSEYKRLTKRDEYRNADIIGVDGEELYFNLEFDKFKLTTEALNRLARYEDIGTPEEFAGLVKAKEEGRLVVLPCKVGNTVYRLWYKPCSQGNDHPDGMMCCGCEDKCDIKRAVIAKTYSHIQHILSDLEHFDKTVFLTREEAEQALKQIGGNKNG